MVPLDDPINLLHQPGEELGSVVVDWERTLVAVQEHGLGNSAVQYGICEVRIAAAHAQYAHGRQSAEVSREIAARRWSTVGHLVGMARRSQRVSRRSISVSSLVRMPRPRQQHTVTRLPYL